MIDRRSNHWQSMPLGLKWLFALNFFSLRPSRRAAVKVEFVSHLFGFAFCVLGLVNEASLVGGIILLANAYLFRLHLWLGDKYGAWYDQLETSAPPG